MPVPVEAPERPTEWKSLEGTLARLMELSDTVMQRARALEERLIQPRPHNKVPVPPTLEGLKPVNEPPLLRLVDDRVQRNVEILCDVADILSRIVRELT